MSTERPYSIKIGVCDIERDWSKKQVPTWCFVFVADCGEDDIVLCEKHLAEALELLRKKIKDEKICQKKK